MPLDNIPSSLIIPIGGDGCSHVQTLWTAEGRNESNSWNESLELWNLLLEIKFGLWRLNFRHCWKWTLKLLLFLGLLKNPYWSILLMKLFELLIKGFEDVMDLPKTITPITFRSRPLITCIHTLDSFIIEPRPSNRYLSLMHMWFLSSPSSNLKITQSNSLHMLI